MRVVEVVQEGLPNAYTEWRVEEDILTITAHLPTGPVEESYDLSHLGEEPVCWKDVLPEAPFGFLIEARREGEEVVVRVVVWRPPSLPEEAPDAGPGT